MKILLNLDTDPVWENGIRIGSALEVSLGSGLNSGLGSKLELSSGLW